MEIETSIGTLKLYYYEDYADEWRENEGRVKVPFYACTVSGDVRVNGINYSISTLSFRYEGAGSWRWNGSTYIRRNNGDDWHVLATDKARAKIIDTAKAYVISEGTEAVLLDAKIETKTNQRDRLRKDAAEKMTEANKLQIEAAKLQEEIDSLVGGYLLDYLGDAL